MKRTTGFTLPQAQELLLRTLRQIEDRTESLVLHALTVDRLAYAIDTATPQYRKDICEHLDKIDSMLPDLNELTSSLKDLRQNLPQPEGTQAPDDNKKYVYMTLSRSPGSKSWNIQAITDSEEAANNFNNVKAYIRTQRIEVNQQTGGFTVKFDDEVYSEDDEDDEDDDPDRVMTIL